jgi:hypothetical protein
MALSGGRSREQATNRKPCEGGIAEEACAKKRECRKVEIPGGGAEPLAPEWRAVGNSHSYGAKPTDNGPKGSSPKLPAQV